MMLSSVHLINRYNTCFSAFLQARVNRFLTIARCGLEVRRYALHLLLRSGVPGVERSSANSFAYAIPHSDIEVSRSPANTRLLISSSKASVCNPFENHTNL